MNIFIVMSLIAIMLMCFFLCSAALYIITRINSLATMKPQFVKLADFASVLTKKANRFFSTIDATDDIDINQ